MNAEACMWTVVALLVILSVAVGGPLAIWHWVYHHEVKDAKQREEKVGKVTLDPIEHRCAYADCLYPQAIFDEAVTCYACLDNLAGRDRKPLFGQARSEAPVKLVQFPGEVQPRALREFPRTVKR